MEGTLARQQAAPRFDNARYVISDRNRLDGHERCEWNRHRRHNPRSTCGHPLD